MEPLIESIFAEAPDANAIAADALSQVVEGRLTPAELSSTLHVCITLHHAKKQLVLNILSALCLLGGLAGDDTPASPPPPPPPPPPGPVTNVFGTEVEDEEAQPSPPPEVSHAHATAEASEDTESAAPTSSSSTSIRKEHIPLLQAVVIEFLRGTNHSSNLELRKDVVSTLTAALIRPSPSGGVAGTTAALPGGIADVVTSRWKPRKNTLLFKSVLPRLAQQIPCTAMRIGDIIHQHLSQANTGDITSALRGELMALLATSRMHHQLFTYIVLRAVIAHHNLHPTVTASLSSPNINRSVPPSLASLFDDETLLLLSLTLQDIVIHTFGIDGDETGGVHAGRIAVLLYTHQLISLRSALSMFFGHLLYSTRPVVEGAHAQTASFEGCLERASKYFTDMEQYIAGTHCETILDQSVSSNTSGLNNMSGRARAVGGSSGSSNALRNGETAAAQFYRVQHSAPLPSWSTLLSTHPEQRMALPWRTFALTMLDEFLALDVFHGAAEFIRELREVLHVDLFGYRGNGVEQKTAANRITQRVEAFLTAAIPVGAESNGADAAIVRGRVGRVLPLLIECQARIGSSIKFTWAVCDVVLQAWSPSPSNDCDLPLRAAFVTQFLIPSLRGAPPSPALHDMLDRLLTTFPDAALIEMRVADAVRGVPRCPHDALRFKELESSFNQNIRRMTLDKVHEYHAIVFPVLLTNPMFVIEKLFQQSIGYENAQASIHAQLLSVAPRSILKLFLGHGLALMRTFAAEEREGAETRVSLVANFLCLVWRVTLKTFDGAFALRQVEVSLRRPARESLVFSNEFLKAAVLQLTSTVCEHEEQYNADQLNALGCFGQVTTWYGRGACASYLGRWHPRHFNPSCLVECRAALSSALNEPLLVPSTTPSSEPAKESIGHAVLVHLAVLDSTVYDILGDISGTMESILLECAKHHNVMNDLMSILATMTDNTPSIMELGSVALPQVALRFESIAARRRWDATAAIAVPATTLATTPSATTSTAASPTANGAACDLSAAATAIAAVSGLWKINDTQLQAVLASTKDINASARPTNDNEEESVANVDAELSSVDVFARVQATLALLQPYHYQYFDDVYTRSKKDADRLLAQVEKELSNPANKSARTALTASRDWVLHQLRLIELERSSHALIHREASDFVDHFLCNDVLTAVAENAVWFAQQCIVTKAALSLSDTLAVTWMLQRLLAAARLRDAASHAESATPSSSSNASTTCVVDLMLTAVTMIMSTFVSWTDGECKRLGSLMYNILRILDGEVVEVRRRQSDTSVALSPAPTSSPVAASQETKSLLSLATNFTSKCRSAATSSWTPAFVLDCDAYLAQGFYQILSTPIKSSPNFCFRNAFILLDRIKTCFPRTPQTAAVMMAAVRNHNDKSSTYFAAATAQLKLYLSILSPAAAASATAPSPSGGGAGSASYMKHLLDSLNAAIARETSEASRIARDLVNAENEEKKAAADAAAAATAANNEEDEDDTSAGLRRRDEEEDDGAADIDAEEGDVGATLDDAASNHSRSGDDDDGDDRDNEDQSVGDDEDRNEDHIGGDNGSDGEYAIGVDQGDDSTSTRKRPRDDDEGE